MAACLGSAGGAYTRELSLLQRNAADGGAAGAWLRHLPGLTEEGVAPTDAAATGAAAGRTSTDMARARSGASSGRTSTDMARAGSGVSSGSAGRV